MFLKTESSAKI